MIPGLALLLFKVGLLPRQHYDQHRKAIFRSVRYLNVAKSFPYADGTFDYVYSSHLLEHLYPEQASFCLREIYRVMKEGGIVRLAVPDLDQIIASYDSQHPEYFLEGIFEAKQKYDKNKHHWHYNETSLARRLREAEFSDIYRCQFRQGCCADVTLIDNRAESLFVEAINNKYT